MPPTTRLSKARAASQVPERHDQQLVSTRRRQQSEGPPSGLVKGIAPPPRELSPAGKGNAEDVRPTPADSQGDSPPEVLSTGAILPIASPPSESSPVVREDGQVHQALADPLCVQPPQDPDIHPTPEEHSAGAASPPSELSPVDSGDIQPQHTHTTVTLPPSELSPVDSGSTVKSKAKHTTQQPPPVPKQSRSIPYVLVPQPPHRRRPHTLAAEQSLRPACSLASAPPAGSAPPPRVEPEPSTTSLSTLAPPAVPLATPPVAPVLSHDITLHDKIMQSPSVDAQRGDQNADGVKSTRRSVSRHVHDREIY